MSVRFDELRATAELAGLDVEQFRVGRTRFYQVCKNGTPISMPFGISNAEDFVVAWIAAHAEGIDEGIKITLANFKAGVQNATMSAKKNGRRMPTAG